MRCESESGGGGFKLAIVDVGSWASEVYVEWRRTRRQAESGGGGRKDVGRFGCCAMVCCENFLIL